MDKERGKETQKDTEGNQERENKIDRGRERLQGCRGDCDHASWISISKQNKYSPRLLLLLCYSHKPFQVPCRPFSHHDLIAWLLGCPSLSSPPLPTAAFFHPIFFSPFLATFLRLSLQQFLVFTFLLLSNLCFSLYVFVSVCRCMGIPFSEQKTRREVGRGGGPGSLHQGSEGSMVLPRGECLISVNGTQESM